MTWVMTFFRLYSVMSKGRNDEMGIVKWSFDTRSISSSAPGGCQQWPGAYLLKQAPGQFTPSSSHAQLVYPIFYSSDTILYFHTFYYSINFCYPISFLPANGHWLFLSHLTDIKLIIIDCVNKVCLPIWKHNEN